MSIAKNTTILTFASVIQKILAFVYFTLVARGIGVENIGKYSFAISFAMIFSIFVDLGLTSAMVREIARARDKIKVYVGTVFSVKILFGVITLGLIYAVINIMNYPEITRQFVYLAGLAIVLDSFHLTFYGVFRGLRVLKYEAVGLIIGQLFILAFGLSVIYLNAPLYFLFIALILGSLFNIIFSFSLVRIKQGFFPWPAFDKKIFLFLGKIASAFALAGIFVKIYSYIDTVLLSYLKGDLAVGWYSIPIKLTLAFQFIPMALVASLYPTLSYYFKESRARLRVTFEKGMRYLILVAVPLAFGIGILADKIILSLYGADFSPSIIPLQILAVGLVFAFLSFPVGSLLNACNKQKVQTIILGLTMVVNIVLNLILIPRYGVIGASITALVSYFFLFSIGIMRARKIVDYKIGFLFNIFVKSLLASIVMIGIISFLKPFVNFVILSLLGMVIYGIVMWIIRGIDKEDITYFRRMFARK
ncbi:MAG: flippase [Patescibacteria group bacterium]|nr:flippase [Patescibacteria group bacterium]